MTRLSTLLVAALPTLAACGGSKGTAPPPAAPAPAPAPAVVETDLMSVGLDPTVMDRGADPCQDFYQFACGSWMQKDQIPADKSIWSRGFSEIEKRNDEDLRGILEQAAKAQGDDPVQAAIGGYYQSCVDEDAIEQAGTAPIAALLGAARSVKDAKTLAAAVAALHPYGIDVVFKIEAEHDFHDAKNMIAFLDEGARGLPDRDLYLSDDARAKTLRAGYTAHVVRMFGLAGVRPADAKQAAADVMAVETALAKISKTRVERRDLAGLYNRIDREGVIKVVPGFPWDEYLSSQGVPDVQAISVTSPAYFEGLSSLLETIKPAAWRSYLTWHVLHATAPYLTRAIVAEDFQFQQLLNGTPEQPPRWKRCVHSTEAALPDLVGQPFVALRFSGDAKAKADALVHAVNAAFAADVPQLAWMDATTQQRALAKLAGMQYRMGFPNQWERYDFAVSPAAYAANSLAAKAYARRHDLAKIGQPVDREDWGMAASTVNATYNPLLNQMTFPAGILQSPFFSPNASDAVNLGGIGMVLGHELTHGYDDQGARFDASGNLLNWWEESTAKEFQSRTQCVVDAYGKYEVLPGAHINGKLTLGENIADLGGIKVAFHAYRALRAGAAQRMVADGFNEDQQFFLSMAQTWCVQARDAEAQLRLQVDPHSPGRFRVLGMVSNLPEFAEAFQCKAGTPMHPDNACSVW